MVKLAAWRIDLKHCEGTSQSEPKRIGRSHIALERNLEEWIVKDVSLIGEGLTLVGRQVTIDDGRLDLLAIDSQERWVVIEIKPGMLDCGALTQALSYASSIVHLGADEIREKLQSRLGDFGDAEQLLATVKQQLAAEEEERKIAVLLVGAGIHPGLVRMNDYLGRFGVPISAVSFEVFELSGGPQLLIREVVEERTKPPSPGRRYTVEAIRRWAVDVGVEEQFDRFLKMAKEAGLAVQPQGASVRIAPAANRTRFLMYVQPRAGQSGGELGIWVGPKQFAEFFPHVREDDAIDALGAYDDGGYLSGEALDHRLDQIERFLTEKLQADHAARGAR